MNEVGRESAMMGERPKPGKQNHNRVVLVRKEKQTRIRKCARCAKRIGYARCAKRRKSRSWVCVRVTVVIVTKGKIHTHRRARCRAGGVVWTKLAAEIVTYKNHGEGSKENTWF